MKQKNDNILVKQAYIYETMQTGKRISIENTTKKTNEKLNVLLNREIVIDKLSTDKLKSHIDLLNVENWKTKLMDSTKANTYRSYKNMTEIEKYFDHIKNIKLLKAFLKFRISDHK